MSTMNKRLDTAIIMILLLILVGIGVSGCAVKQQSTQDPSHSGIYSGSIGVVLGCVFEPSNCEKFKKDADQDDITRDFEALDKATTENN